MTAHHRWLRQEIARWQHDGLVDAALAERLQARYPAEGERSWGRMAFSVLGAALVGLGVILFFAYNWAGLPKAAKMALVFAALAGAHGSAIVLARRTVPGATLTEGLHALGTVLFGAAIWLVAQIYHIDEHYPNAFLVWTLGALALAWAMPSIVQAFLALALVAFWAGIELFQFHAPMHGAPVLVALGLLPLGWWRRSPALLFFALVVLFVVSAFALGGVRAGAVLPFVLLLGAAAFTAGIAAALSSFGAGAGPFFAAGLIATLVTSYALSFPGTAREFLKIAFDDNATRLYLAVAAALLVAALVAAAMLLARRGWSALDVHRRWRAGLVALALVIAVFTVLARPNAAAWALALPYNVIVLALAATLILEGSASLRPGRVAAGCIVFAIVMLSRYADLFTSLLARSAVFVALGAGLFVVGNFYARQRRQAKEARA